MIRKILLVVAVILMILSAIGCQTVQGLGGDIKWMGEKCGEMLEGE